MTDAEKFYGGILFELAVKEDCHMEIMQQLNVISKLFYAHPDYLKILSSPSLAEEQRLDMIDRLLTGQVHSYLLNFIKILIRSKRISTLEGCREAYSSKCDQDSNLVRVTAVAAWKPDEGILNKLKTKLEKILKKTVILEVKIDEGCLGGMILQYEGRRIDGSVKSRLEALKNQMIGMIP